MSNYSLSHLSNGTLLRDLQALVARDRTITAALLAHLAETDARKLYLPAGYPRCLPTAFKSCGCPRMLPTSASRRRAQRRQFPALFTAVAEGRLNLTGVGLLAPHLTPENADELLGSSAGKSKAEIEELVARRFPARSYCRWCGRSCPGPRAIQATCAGASWARRNGIHRDLEWVPGRTTSRGPPQDGASRPRTLRAPAHHRQEHSRQAALRASLAQPQDPEWRSRSGARERARRPDRTTREAQVRGNRSAARYDALDSQRSASPRARAARRLAARSEAGARSSVIAGAAARRASSWSSTTRTRQHAAARRQPRTCDYAVGRTISTRASALLGPSSWPASARRRGKRQPKARGAVIEEQARARAEEQAKQEAEDQAKQQAKQKASEVIPWLRALGFRADEARSRAERCESIPDASLEERVRLALSYVSPRIASHRPAPA